MVNEGKSVEKPAHDPVVFHIDHNGLASEEGPQPDGLLRGYPGNIPGR